MEVPVVVNGKSPVLKDHCQKSKGGLYYESYEEFEEAADFLLLHREERARMGKNGRKYVDAHYRWESILDGLNGLINKCIVRKGEGVDGKEN